MTPRRLPILILGLALLAPACSGKGNAGPNGKDIQTATTYSLQTIPSGSRWKAPPWTATDLSGAPISSAQFAGAITVVNFWASWCGPCRAEQPELEKLWNDYKGKGVRFLGINIRDTRVNAVAHTSEFNVSYPSVYNQDETLAYRYRVLFIPETYIVGRDGKVSAREIGETRDTDMRQAIDAELAR